MHDFNTTVAQAAEGKISCLCNMNNELFRSIDWLHVAAYSVPKGFLAGMPKSSLLPRTFTASGSPLKSAFDFGFAFEAFLMGGGWLIFGDAQQLWIRDAAAERGACDTKAAERSEA